MKHECFVIEWKAGRLNVEVDRSLALQVANSKMLPRRYQFAHLFWSWGWMLSIPAALAVMFFAWWAGLLILFVLTPLLSKSTKTSAMQFMIDHSLENPEFYEWAVENRVLVVSEKPSDTVA